MEKKIVIRGAREHNLKGVNLEVPRDRLVVFTGLSGSGKSSLAFDTLYAEGQRRYLESLSTYVRQFLDQMRKPDVDSIDGLSPAISIEQKYISRNPRSTVGTITEIYDFLRLLFARAGDPHCFECGSPILSQTVNQIVQRILDRKKGEKFSILAPLVRGKKGEYQKELLELRAKGFVRARIDGAEVNLAEPIKLKKQFKHDISVYIDRLVVKEGAEPRTQEAVSLAAELAGGLVEVEFLEEGKPVTRFFSTKFACANCGASFPEIEPRTFSFNSPHGACASCSGLGTVRTIDPQAIVPDPRLSLYEGAIAPWAEKSEEWKTRVYETLAKQFKFDPTVPYETLSESIKLLLLYGTDKSKVSFSASGKKGVHKFEQQFEGAVTYVTRALDEQEGEEEESLTRYVTYQSCPVCAGSRLRKEAACVLIGGRSIASVSALSVSHCVPFFRELKFAPSKQPIAEPILKEVCARLEFLQNVGLDYLTLDRAAATLSGGEAQRIRLASQIGSNLVGVLYVLDEPSIGLHQRDNDRLLGTLERLRDIGNSVIVVEHDQETIERADFVVDLGPGAGVHGGSLVYSGPPKGLTQANGSLTGDYLAGRRTIPVPEHRRPPDPERTVRIRGARQNNLKNVDVDLPLGRFLCVTGVSGSGKSTLIIDTLLPALQGALAGKRPDRQHVSSIDGLGEVNRVIHVDQSPIGRTPRSNPATYTGIFTEIRTLFAGLPESRMRGYTLSRFSFNVKGGRCEGCGGDGNIKVSMHFLPDVFVPCEVCRGKRYNRETLEVHYRGKNISDVLEMPIEEAAGFFERVPSLQGKLRTLQEVGLGYIRLGQSAVTLSGGEAQRMKLSRELSRRGTGRTLYVLDEPTTGLHFEDVRRLLEMLQALVTQGNTVLVIEHNLDVIKQADYVIDLGPEGGEGGGQVIFQGTPEDLLKVEHSHTGQYLKPVLQGRRGSASSARASLSGAQKQKKPPVPVAE